MQCVRCNDCPDPYGVCDCIKKECILHNGQYFLPTGVRGRLEKPTPFGLTKRERDLLVFIDSYTQAKDGISPSYEEMAAALSLKSKSGVHRLVTACEKRGYLKRLPNQSRAIVLTSWPLPK